MNIMRKLRSSASTPASSAAGGSAGANNASSSSAPVSASGSLEGGSSASAAAAAAAATDSPPDSPHTQLGLMHLKKLFNEYTHPKEPLNEKERDFKLYNMLPLFCKVSECEQCNIP